MAHWAEIDENNIVLRVVVGNNDDPDEGYSWLTEKLGGTWLKTSYNTMENVHLLGGEPYRKNFARIGYAYREDLDAFIPPQPYPSWILDEYRGVWMPPVPKPEDWPLYVWDEDSLSWLRDMIPFEEAS